MSRLDNTSAAAAITGLSRMRVARSIVASFYALIQVLDLARPGGLPVYECTRYGACERADPVPSSLAATPMFNGGDKSEFTTGRLCGNTLCCTRQIAVPYKISDKRKL